MFQSSIFSRFFCLCMIMIAVLGVIPSQITTANIIQGGTITATQSTNASNEYEFELTNPPPMPQTGTQQPYRTYFWDFGDGHFSYDSNPTHIFELDNNNSSNNTYEVVLRTTRIKSDDDIEESRVTITINCPNNPGLTQNQCNYTKKNTPVNMKGNSLRIDATRTPRINSFVEYIVSYKNICENPRDGTLIFEYDADIFTGYKIKGYKEESVISSKSRPGFLAIKSENLGEYEQRNIFIELTVDPTTSPNVGVECSAKLAYGSTGLNCIGTNNPVFLRQGTVQSHDPNLKQVNQLSICPKEEDLHDPCNNQDLLRTLTYTIRFQNIGEGPAEEIHVTDVLHPYLENHIFNIQTSHSAAYKGQVDMTGDQNRELAFHFSGIDLKGTNQAGYGIDFCDADTWASITYQVEISDQNELPACGSILNQAVVVFDCNAPLTTTTAITRIQNDNCCDCETFCVPDVPNFSEEGNQVVFNIGTKGAIPLTFSNGFFTECFEENASQFSYLWYPNTGLNNPNVLTPIASPSKETVYTLTIFDDSNNIRGPMAQVVVAPSNPCSLPTISIGPLGPIQTSNPKIRLEFNNTNRLRGCFQWYRNGDLLVGQTENALEVNDHGTYHLEYEEEGCVVSSNQVRVI